MVRRLLRHNKSFQATATPPPEFNRYTASLIKVTDLFSLCSPWFKKPDINHSSGVPLINSAITGLSIKAARS